MHNRRLAIGCRRIHKAGPEPIPLQNRRLPSQWAAAKPHSLPEIDNPVALVLMLPLGKPHSRPDSGRVSSPPMPIDGENARLAEERRKRDEEELLEWRRGAAVFFEHLKNPDRKGPRDVHEDRYSEWLSPRFKRPKGV